MGTAHRRTLKPAVARLWVWRGVLSRELVVGADLPPRCGGERAGMGYTLLECALPPR